jgi:four helix bundle protein
MTKSFEEFDVHKKSILLTKLIFELLKNKNFEKEFGFKEQMKRAVVSITNNIAEGSGCAEVRNMLILSKELGFCDEQNIQISYNVTIEISQNISNFIKYLNSKLEESK